MSRSNVIGAVATVALLLTSCGTESPSPGEAPTSAVSEDEARSMGESMLNALNEGDYAAWSENWTAELRNAIGEEAFIGFRDQALEQRGAFREIVSVELQPGSQPGFVRWVVTAEHEEGTSELAMAFASDGSEMTGVFWEPVD